MRAIKRLSMYWTLMSSVIQCAFKLVSEFTLKLCYYIHRSLVKRINLAVTSLLLLSSAWFTGLGGDVAFSSRWVCLASSVPGTMLYPRLLDDVLRGGLCPLSRPCSAPMRTSPTFELFFCPAMAKTPPYFPQM